MNNENMNNEKIQKAFSSHLKIHLTLKDDTFRNGFVKEISPDFFLFDDSINGREPIFFLELKNIEPFMEMKI